MDLIERSNWLSFNIYFPPNTLLNDIPERNRCYFEFLREHLTPFLDSRLDQIQYLFFSHYIDQRPIDNILVNHFNIKDWNQKLRELPDPIKSQLGNNLRYIRLRFFVRDDTELIQREFISLLDNLNGILGYESVEYDVLSDLGKRFSNQSNTLSEFVVLKRMKSFIEYWNSICRYILSIITDDFNLDFENVDVKGILHLGFNALGNALPIGRCQNCGGILSFMTNYPIIGYFKCKCIIFQKLGTIPYL